MVKTEKWIWKLKFLKICILLFRIIFLYHSKSIPIKKKTIFAICCKCWETWNFMHNLRLTLFNYEFCIKNERNFLHSFLFFRFKIIILWRQKIKVTQNKALKIIGLNIHSYIHCVISWVITIRLTNQHFGY